MQPIWLNNAEPNNTWNFNKNLKYVSIQLYNTFQGNRRNIKIERKGTLKLARALASRSLQNTVRLPGAWGVTRPSWMVRDAVKPPSTPPDLDLEPLHPAIFSAIRPIAGTNIQNQTICRERLSYNLILQSISLSLSLVFSFPF